MAEKKPQSKSEKILEESLAGRTIHSHKHTCAFMFNTGHWAKYINGKITLSGVHYY